MSKENTTNEPSDIIETPIEPKDGKIGTMLHDVRIKKKLTIEDVSKELRIKANYLTAIENSDYDNIPEEPYGIGFIRSYASYLGLNSSRLVQIFKEETKQDKKSFSETIISNTDTDISPIEEEHTESYIPNKNYIIISFVMLLLVYIVWQFSVSKETEDEYPVEEIQTDTTNQTYPIQIENYTIEDEDINASEDFNQINTTEESFYESESSKEINTPKETLNQETTHAELSIPNLKEETKANAVSPKKGRVVLKIKKETWVEVKDDNKLWISKVLQAGDEYIIPDNGEGKTVSFGNTDGVDVIIDGKIVTIVSKDKKTNIKLDAFLGNH